MTDSTTPATPTATAMPVSLNTLLAFTAGYADAAGFLALHGLFTAHVTGNFVTLGASLVEGTAGGVSKLLALPTFCAVLFLVRLLHHPIAARGWPVLKAMLVLECAILITGAALAWHYGPFADGDSGIALVTGLVLVAAMAIQNGVQRVHLAHLPPTTIMTGTTTQIMLDAADLVHGVPAAQAAVIRPRMRRMVKGVSAFASGCGLAAVGYYLVATHCFATLPLLAALILAHPESSAPHGKS